MSSETEISNLLNYLRVLAKKRSLDFDINGILSDYRRLIGISARDFNNLYRIP